MHQPQDHRETRTSRQQQLRYRFFSKSLWTSTRDLGVEMIFQTSSYNYMFACRAASEHVDPGRASIYEWSVKVSSPGAY